RRARAGETLRDTDFHALLRFADGAGGAQAEALRALLGPGRRGEGFYLDDAFAPDLAAARAELFHAHADVERARDAIAARLRAACGVDAAGDEAIVLRDVYDGAFPAGIEVVRETAGYRIIALRADTSARDGALERLADAERRARRALADAIAQSPSASESARGSAPPASVPRS
ncbi:MAG TPA: hypothetical protein VHT53_04420, partial [Candidatus Elarobacter sp.]|nr:hypothetical protein [Candidatus Elarobacter sp.]